MCIKIHIDVTLLPLTGGQRTVEVKGEKVSQCLEELRVQFPGLKQMFDSEGNLWSDISLYLNRHSIYNDPPVKDGDELTIEVGVAGG